MSNGSYLTLITSWSDGPDAYFASPVRQVQSLLQGSVNIPEEYAYAAQGTPVGNNAIGTPYDPASGFSGDCWVAAVSATTYLRTVDEIPVADTLLNQ